jgi:hypothetical protein
MWHPAITRIFSLLAKRIAILRNAASRRARGYRGRESNFQLPVPPFQRRIAMLQKVEEVLNASRIDHRCQIHERSAYCAVRERDLQLLCDALNQIGQESGPRSVQVWFGHGLSFDTFGFADALRVRDIERCDSLIVAVPFKNGRLRVGRSGGAEILIIEKRGSRHIAKQQWAGVVDWTLHFDGNGKSRGRPSGQDETGVLGSRPKRHALEREPIDVVYTWVDSDDPDWRNAMQWYAGRQESQLDSACNEQRFINRDELRYSLRSVAMYAPFVRHIYLVTAGHYPRWLDCGHENIHIVTHDAIFPDQDDLPTFNSHAIECCLHRIPGLSENFIYFNDDVFLRHETTLNTYFTKMGMIKTRFSDTAYIPDAQPDMTSTPTDWSTYNAAAIIGRDFGIRFDRKLQHTPMAMKRSVLYEIEERYADLVSKTRGARFRSHEDLAVTGSLAHFYGISTGRAVDWNHEPGEYIYIDTGWAGLEARLAAMDQSDATFVCLNATRHAEVPLDKQGTILGSFLEESYPAPSPYELSDESARAWL